MWLAFASIARAQDGGPRDAGRPRDGGADAANGAADAGAPTTVAPGTPRYMPAIDAELTAMGIEHTCEPTGTVRALCTFHRAGPSGRDFDVKVVYSDDSDTIYMFVERYIVAAADADTTPAVLRRLMELNWQLLVGKLEWHSTDGEVRIAFVLNTDSNFDRRSFRSCVRSIVNVADRYYPELSRLVEPDAAARAPDAGAE